MPKSIDFSPTHQLYEAGNFLQKHKNAAIAVLAGCLLLILVSVTYWGFYLPNREQEAQEQLFVSVKYFQQKQWDKALDGDGSYPGFEQIIDTYSGVKVVNLTHYYAGIAYLHKGEFQKSIKHLEKYKAKDELTSVTALGATGDAYSELEMYPEALSFYEKAIKQAGQKVLGSVYLLKAGLVYEQLGEQKKALLLYKKVQRDFPNEPIARDIENYIARVEVNL